MTNSNIGIGIAGVVVGLLLSVVFGGSSMLGGVYNQSVTDVSNGLRAGSDGTTITNMKSGTCNAATTQLPLEATSTDNFTCSVTGVVAGDRVLVELPSDGGSVYGGFNVTYSAASTDTITFGVQNNTGAATSSFPLATTSIHYWIVR